MAGKIIVIFVEGDTEQVFYSIVCKKIKTKKGTSTKTLIKNLRGISKFESKVHTKLYHEVLKKYPDSHVKVFLAYDTDVFDIPFQEKPPVNWKKVEKRVKDLGVREVYHLKAKKSIEDWFLKDIDGLRTHLGMKKSTIIRGSSGYEKIKALFKKANKIYQKGFNTSNFVENLDYDKLLEFLNEELKQLNKAL